LDRFVEELERRNLTAPATKKVNVIHT
jgi:hypothetical protein